MPNTSSALQHPEIPTYSEDRDPGNSWETWAGSFQIIQHETDLKQRETFQSKQLQLGRVKQHRTKHHPSSWTWQPRRDLQPPLSVPMSHPSGLCHNCCVSCNLGKEAVTGGTTGKRPPCATS